MLQLFRSARADQLVDALGQQLVTPLADPVRAEVVCVSTRGVERWISQKLSHHLGVCANVDFPFPGSLVDRVVAAASGIDPDSDPWRPERAVWALVDIVDRAAGDPLLAPLVAHLDAVTPHGEPRRRFAFLRHVADLFDRYGIHRPAMVARWVDHPARADEPDAWQHHLWRLLRSRLDLASPAERLPGAAAAIAAGQVDLDLPERLSVFGLTRLPAVHLEVLTAVASTRDVGLYLLHPSAVLWSKLGGAGGGLWAGAGGGGLARRSDPTRLVAVNPLLRSWGRDAREMQVVLAARGVAGGEHLEVADPAGPVTLLGALQHDIRADREPGQDLLNVDRSDESVRIYACHGRPRQVEVLRDAILHRLAADPTLEARDIIVMCPDIEAFAPLFQSAFDSRGLASGPALRARLADRSLRQTNPLLAVAARLLELASSRVTASEVLDLAALEPVARRFGFDPDELGLIERWVADTGIHWGFDRAHRSRWQLGEVGEGTWSAGLDRLLLGVAVASESELVLGTVAYGDLPSSLVDLVGRLTELVYRLRAAVESLQGPHRVGEWADRLRDATESLAATDGDTPWPRQQMQEVLAGAADEAAGADGALSLDEVRSLLAGRLAGRPTRANFRTGDLTFCTLVPMRSVPHRVVALVGLDEGAFPRHPDIDGDDLLLREPLVGERETRSEDRQLLLDALLAATEHLIVTYSGRDLRTNQRRPPCPPIAELIDVIDATARADDGRPASEDVLVEVPLQAHDPLNFASGGLGRPGPWSFDPLQLAGAVATRRRSPPPPWLDGPLPARRVEALSVDELVRFVRHPVKEFLRQRLDLHLGRPEGRLEDDVPLVLDALEKWGIGDRMLEVALRGVDVEDAARVESARGFLPPEAIRRSPLDDILRGVRDLMSHVEHLDTGPGPASSRLVGVDLGGGVKLSGSVSGVQGSTVVQVVYSRLAAKHRLAAWVRFLALTADRPDLEVRAVSVGRAGGSAAVSVIWLDPPGGAGPQRRSWAVGQLRRLVQLMEAGLQLPLPLPARTACAWVEAGRDGRDTRAMIDAAAYQWEGVPAGAEAHEPEYATVWPGGRSFADLLAERPGPADTAHGWPVGETSRFGGYARLLWDPLLAHERIEQR